MLMIYNDKGEPYPTSYTPLGTFHAFLLNFMSNILSARYRLTLTFYIAPAVFSCGA